MKVNGANGAGAPAGPGRPRATGGGDGFRLPTAAQAGAPTQVVRSSGPAGVMDVSALLALQELGSPLERRRKAVGRAGKILDVLDDVKLGLLSGELSSGDLERLQRAIREERGDTEDERLEGLLNEIETRAAVELAKLERARGQT